MPTIDDFYQARRFMVDALRSELIGTADDDVLTEKPLDRFVTGILYPQEQPNRSAQRLPGAEEYAPAAEDSALETERLTPDADEIAEATEELDFPISLAHVRHPSACGLSLSVPAATKDLRVHVDAARYLESEGAWHRKPFSENVTLAIPEESGCRSERLTEGLSLRLVTRNAKGAARALTLAIVNDLETPQKGDRDGYAWYQVGLEVECSEGFLDRPVVVSSGLEDEDVAGARLLFRGVRNLAIGHGCATEWTDATTVTRLAITFLPSHEVPRADTFVEDVTLPMSVFAQSTDHSQLRGLVTAYRRWIAAKTAEADNLPRGLKAQAHEHLLRAGEAADRIEEGITLLAEEPVALRAFQLMNGAMREQRDRQDQVRKGSKPAEQYWRPFQVAFILMNLPGLTDPHSKDRDFVDLLWFPTGGGKTEAYLGLVAYSILLRRLRNPKDAGVSVLMRYTLRLLTLQQFERAAGLICALELVRQREIPEAMGISLGLWVGRGATPNSLDDAKKALKRLREGQSIETENPMQLAKCPWCGTRLSPSDYRAGVTAMTIRCPDESCEFSGGLPVHVIDQDVYANRPSLVIGTVDKFAMMAWREEAQTLFSTDGRHSRPDLIIQDELHLISGPLGTMVGLYETAVDAACSQGGKRPKIVASTATIRRATDQVKRVFDRGTRQFPPPGLNHHDSFFSVDAPKNVMGTREYVGVLAQGATHTYLMVRVYAALLQAAAELDAEAEVRDAYWTLMGYFNSLRVLGGAAIQATDDVPAQMQVIANRHGQGVRDLEEPYELTSRISSSDVPERLKQLAAPYLSPDALDVVLATNMISVGLDIDRLGLMAVMGQPQATAEYIQATSRVGRRNPGLVVVIYNSARSRDLSHYEGFAGFHRTLYRHVEPNSVTPFSPRARDRGLHGALVAATRSLVPELRADSSPGRLAGAPGLLEPVIEAILRRVSDVSPEEADATNAQLRRLAEAWERADAPTLSKYAGWFTPEGALLAQVDPSITQPDDPVPVFPVEDAPWPTLTSLRDVDAQSSLFIVREGSR